MFSARNKIGIQAVKSTDDIPLSTIIDQLQVLNIWSLTQNQSVVFDSTIQAWINILYALHYSPLNKFEQHADTIFEYIFTSINLTQNLKTRNIYFYSLISIFTDWLKSKLVIIFSMQLQRKYEHPEVLLKSLEELQRALRSYSDKSTSLNVNLFSVIGQFLIFVEEFIHRWIVKEQNTQVKEELKKQLLWFTHLPYWFMHNKTKIDLNDYEDLLDSSILVGLRSSVELADLELIENSASAINSMLKKIVAKENPTSGFDEPRAALKMVYLGIIALKKNYTQLFKQIKKYLLDTEKDYQAKHKEFLNKISGLHDIQFLIELWRWRDDFSNEKLNGKHSNFDPLRSLLIEHIEIEDIDRFIFAVWGACDDMCSLRKEHLKRIAIIEKKSAMRNIIRCLKLIALSKK